MGGGACRKLASKPLERWHLKGLPERPKRTTKGRKRTKRATPGRNRDNVGQSAMPPRGSKALAKPTSKLIAHNFLPTLTKPQEVVGSFIVMPGREWAGCPAADKDKLFKFAAVHDFGALKCQICSHGGARDGSVWRR